MELLRTLLAAGEGHHAADGDGDDAESTERYDGGRDRHRKNEDESEGGSGSVPTGEEKTAALPSRRPLLV